MKSLFFPIGLKTLDTSETTAGDADISALLRQAIERGERGTAENQQILGSAGVQRQERKATMEGLLLSFKKRNVMDTKVLNKPVKQVTRKLGHQARASLRDTKKVKPSGGGGPIEDFTQTALVYDQQSSLEAKGDFMETSSSSSTRDDTDYQFVLQGPTQSVTPTSPLGLTLSPLNERLQTAYKNRSRGSEDWDTISELENAKDNRSERKTSHEWKLALQEEDDTEKDDKKESVKRQRVVNEGSSRHGTARRHTKNAKLHEIETTSEIRGSVSHTDHGSKIDNKSREIKKKKKNVHSLVPTDSGSVMESHALFITATVCVGIMLFLLIITGLARVW